MTTPSALADALGCCDRGHRPVPLMPGTKVPPRGFDLLGWLGADALDEG